MYSTEILTQVVDYQKKTFDKSYDMMTIFQDQGFDVMEKTMEKNLFWPEDSRKMHNSWVDFSKQSLKGYKEYVDCSFDSIKAYFEKPAPVAKPKKTTKK